MTSRSATTFVGREAELEILTSALASLDDAGCRTVLLAGDAGIGKTRLVEELLDRASTAGALAGAGVCTPAEGGALPYGPIVAILRDLARQVDPRVADTLFEEVRARLTVAETPRADATRPDDSRTRLFESMLETVTRLAERSRVALVFEDVHWADSASLDLILFLTRNLRAEPVLFVVTYREDEADARLRRWIAELPRVRHAAVIELDGLDRDATGRLMADILGSPPTWTMLDAVHARSGGNPFFAEELTASRDEARLPAVLRHVVMMRIDALPADVRTVAAAVAVAGRAVDHRLLAAVVDLGEAEIEAAIAVAIARGVLVVDDGLSWFRHALQRDAVYETTLPATRSRLHHRMAVALAEHPELATAGPAHARVEVAGHHWAAGDLVEVIPSAIAAGDALLALGAPDEADTHYGRALAAQEQLGDIAPAVDDPVGLLLRAADAAYLAEGGQIRSADLAERAVARLPPDVEPVRGAAALRMLGRNCWAAGRPQEALDALRRAATLLPADPPTAELAALVAEEARLLMLSSHDAAAIARCREAIALAHRAGASTAEGHARCTLGCSLANLGDVESGIAEGYAALALAHETGEMDLLQRVYMNLTYTLMAGGRLEDAVALTTAADREGTLPFSAAAASTNVVEALLMLGRDDDADAIVDELEYVGRASCAFGPHGARAEVKLARRDLDGAAAHIREAAALTEGIETLQVRGALLLLEAKLALERSEPAEAFARIEEALALATGTDDHSFQPEFCAVGARALADTLERDRARGRTVDVDKLRRIAGGLVAEAAAHVDALDVGPSGAPPRTRAFLLTTQAEATRITGSDRELWCAAADAWAAAEERPRVAYTLFRAAEAGLARRSGRPDAERRLREAWVLASEIGRPGLLAPIERLARRARIRLDHEPVAARTAQETAAEDLGLTAREAEVLDQLARGRTDGQIAEDLFISKKTASVHVSNILRKLGVGNRIEAGEIGQQAGLGRD